MRAVALTRYLPITEEDALLDVEIQEPTPREHDLIVRVHAVSINPADAKVRAPKPTVEKEPRVLGWDAAGEVVDVGSAVGGFRVGDKVYYAGDITRPGCNSELHAIDARLVGHMPRSLDYAHAAALPLTAITAWEALFERARISSDGKNKGQTLLVIGGAGGVGSIAIQLAKHVAGLEVVATASRPESSEWVRKCGADHVINHHEPLVEQLERVVGRAFVDHVLCLNATQQHWDAMCKVIAPQGLIVSIVESPVPLDVSPLIMKSAGLVWEGMFTRSIYSTPDMAEQGRILDRIAELVDRGIVASTATTIWSPINASSLKRAHAQLESGSTIGKLVVTGWG
jgi:zinc-binding alcohol dehydrogenase family protein